MKQIINAKYFSTLIFLLSIAVAVKVIWILISFFFLPNAGEEYQANTKAKALYYRVKLTNQAATIRPTTMVNKAPVVTIGTMRGIKLLALYSASDALVVTVAKGSKTTVLGGGEKIDGFTLTAAGATYAIFKKAGKEFRLELNSVKVSGKQSISRRPTAIVSNTPNNNKIEDDDGRKIVPRNLLTSYTNDPDKIWKDIGIGENKVSGQLHGFKINYVKQGSDFQKLGLKRGDLLMGINGEELNSYAAAMSFFKDINDIENLTLTVERNGKSEDIEYEIK